ncbi:signal peptide protein [Paenibacillus sp. LHD-117]|nr:signal peptide protein [Paenibacillus sp. LHD-117]MDQ6420025.1 signal peptide protein [Paenibacillus sp. LHD-117]
MIVPALAIALVLAGCSSNTQSVFHTDSSTETANVSDTSRVPWDYKIVEGTVGDLIGSDMTVLPDNTLMPNDGNYATGDKVWSLQFMDAEMVTDAQKRNEIRLSAWRTIKTYKDEKSAQGDMDNLKLLLTTEVDLVGVYKTEYNGETRNFAVVELPSGNRMKQPIDDKRYDALAKQKTVNVYLEEVHDFADYDLAYAKFRGWAN